MESETDNKFGIKILWVSSVDRPMMIELDQKWRDLLLNDSSTQMWHSDIIKAINLGQISTQCLTAIVSASGISDSVGGREFLNYLVSLAQLELLGTIRKVPTVSFAFLDSKVFSSKLEYSYKVRVKWDIETGLFVLSPEGIEKPVRILDWVVESRIGWMRVYSGGYLMIGFLPWELSNDELITHA